MEKIIIFDTTMRDGEQTPGVNLNAAEKLELAKELETLGVDVMEVGFPAASPGDFEAVQKVAHQVRNSTVCGLSRALPKDVENCWLALKDAVSPRIHVFIATSVLHLLWKLKMRPDEVIECAVAAVKQAKLYCDDVQFSAEDATRTEKHFLYRIFEETIKAGATTINIPDTVGYTNPEEYYDLITDIKNNVEGIENVVISTHCHDDLGLATSNALAAIRAGARQVEGSMNGIGERAGNTALEEVIMGIHTRKNYYNFITNIKTENIYRTSQMVSRLTGIEIAPNKAIIGYNAFRHESGIHQHGMMSNPNTYEIMTPESIGVPLNLMVLGKHSGRHAFEQHLQELGYHLSANEMNQAFQRFKELADRKKDIRDKDLEAVIGSKTADIPPIYQLDSFKLSSGNKITATAEVVLLYEDNPISATAEGDGPVDAAFKAIDQIIGLDISLESYALKAVTEGKDALGEVKVRVKYEGRHALGKGLASDIIESSICAYINAINRVLSETESKNTQK